MKFDPPKLSSSYAANRLGKTIYQIVFDLAPQKVIEFGVLHGYSLVCIAKALQHLGRGGYVIGYDLWEDYPFNHGNMNEVKRILKKYEIENVVILKKLDINLWLKSPEEFDLLHLDVSNEGEILQRVVDRLEDRFNKGAVMIFEGGTLKRDLVYWMRRYNKSSINPLKKTIGFNIINEKFPGLSIIDRQNKINKIQKYY